MLTGERYLIVAHYTCPAVPLVVFSWFSGWVAISPTKSQTFSGDLRTARCTIRGTRSPVVPFSPLFWLGGFPYLKSTKNKNTHFFVLEGSLYLKSTKLKNTIFFVWEGSQPRIDETEKIHTFLFGRVPLPKIDETKNTTFLVGRVPLLK